MPRTEKEKIGELHRYRTVKTFGDKVKEAIQNILGVCVLVGVGIVIAAIFG
ncbi:hypothetical protein [Pontivivens ytuae]|uniref:Uncharacterized protein n=1 Tax=Pontivivens ytuae TaxID=2789856 RepID=A0A7S9LT21_9RHOB|nr:hypothetical protein [Pontivivens ytuae]QPH54673.1 hypothetical protein I0K15_02505 [Pontivivens ytuae]